VGGRPGIRIDSSVTNAIVQNNVSYLNAGGNYGDAGTGTTADHNLFGVDPKFLSPSTNDYHLTDGSPAIDAGRTVSRFNADLEGITRPQGAARDIGAYEFH